MKTISTLCIGLCLLGVSAQEIPMFVGTYTSGESRGIYLYRFDPETADAELEAVVETANPSFLAKSGDGRTLYAVNETEDSSASLSAFALGGKSPVFLNALPTNGAYPCHVAVSKKHPIAVVSNYGGGSLAVYRLEKNGALGSLAQHIQHSGSGPDRDRQNASHVHSAFFSPDFQRVYVQDLGSDRITVHKVQQSGRDFTLAQEQAIGTPPGGGPRHLAMDKKEKNLYVLLEMTGEVAHYRKNGKNWTLVQSVSMNDAGFRGANGAAEIKLSPDEKFLYASNRGDADAITLFAIDRTGAMRKKAVYGTKGKAPRNFNLSPDGRFLLVANQQSDNIAVFRRNPQTGELTDTGREIRVPAPVCVLF